MSGTTDRQTMQDRRIEAGLAELFGSERPPDVSERVMAAMERDPRPAPDTAGSRSRPWLAAALVLLGLGVVFAVTRLRREDAAQRVLQEPREPAFVVVEDLADVQALPVDTIAVDAHDLDHEAVAALTRLQALRHLRLRYGEQVRDHGDSLAPRHDAGNRRSIDDQALGPLATLLALERLDLAGARNVRGHGLRFLRELPRLETLRLLWCDVTDEGVELLPQFPALRELRIHGNLAIGPAGLRAIAACRQIDHFDLSACPQLHEDDLVVLGSMQGLRNLRLDNLSVLRNDDRSLPTAEEAALRSAVIEAAQRPGAGVTDKVLLALPPLRLHVLTLRFASFAGNGMRAIAGMDHLILLDLMGNDGVRDEHVAALPRGLLALGLAGCRNLTAATVAGLDGMHLQSLSLADATWLTDEGLAHLLARHPLRRHLDVGRCTGLTAASVDRLVAASIHDLRVTGVRGWTSELAARLRQQGRRIEFRVW
ncbi:MAG: hypothetical protein KF830_06050 [Planctomycetes bacterium]|nr:hypothetical protein [Planctomycetota bacterium]